MAKKRRTTTRRRRRSTVVAARKGSARRSGGKRKTTKRRGKRRGTSAGTIKLTPMNIALGSLGALIAVTYKDDARIVKYIKDPKLRYASITAVGAGLAGASFIPFLGKMGQKAPEAVRALGIGMAIGGGLETSALLFPKLLPAPKPSIGATASVKSNGAALSTKRMGRLSDGQLRSLRDMIREGGERMNGRMPRGVMMGDRRAATMMGSDRRTGVMMGRPFSGSWT